MSRPPLIVLVGPTAVGKTALALALAERCDVEVVSADSRQIYRHMDIATAKPTPEERRRLPHHLIDVVDPDEVLTLAQYQELAFSAIDEVRAGGRLPVLVGGTGLYVWAIVENWLIPRVAPDPSLRRELEREAEATGPEQLHARLAAVDPEGAARIHPRNLRRVIRALEVYLVSGSPISGQQRRGDPRYRTLMVGLTAERQWLYERADRRVDAMIEAGLVEETKALLAAGYPVDAPAMSGLGYRQIADYLGGRSDLDEAIRRIKTGTHRYIRQQYTWFREDDPRLDWFCQPVDVDEVVALVRRFLAGEADGPRGVGAAACRCGNRGPA